MNKLLKFLGFNYCIMCGKLRFFGKRITWYNKENGKRYRVFLCKHCYTTYRED
jgi:hypothetical protein